MDRALKKKRWSLRMTFLVAGTALGVAVFLYSFIISGGGSKLTVEKGKLSVYTVRRGDFQEYIAVMGKIVPAEIENIEAIQSGTIKKIYKESGDFVQKGDVILELTNSSLELNVMVQESSLYYQLSTIRSSKLQLNQNNLNQLSQLATYNYQLNLSEPQYRRYKVLLEKKLVSQWEFDQVNEQYLVYKKQKELFLSTYTSDSVSRANQLEQISMSEQRMIESLKGIRNTLNDLTVRAPISGQLSTPKFEVGQTMNQGTRIGQVYVLNKFELNASVDETYLSRVAVGQAGSFELDGRDYRVKISKVYPAVNNGAFQVDMNFAGEVPASLTGGQNVYMKLEMSNPYQATLLSLGSFYNKTGGKWVYVIDPGGGRAQKRSIRVGNKNPLFYEVLDGLKEGERVITSSYDLYKDYDILILK